MVKIVQGLFSFLQDQQILQSGGFSPSPPHSLSPIASTYPITSYPQSYNKITIEEEEGNRPSSSPRSRQDSPRRFPLPSANRASRASGATSRHRDLLIIPITSVALHCQIEKSTETILQILKGEEPQLEQLEENGRNRRKRLAAHKPSKFT